MDQLARASELYPVSGERWWETFCPPADCRLDLVDDATERHLPNSAEVSAIFGGLCSIFFSAEYRDFFLFFVLADQVPANFISSALVSVSVSVPLAASVLQRTPSIVIVSTKVGISEPRHHWLLPFGAPCPLHNMFLAFTLSLCRAAARQSRR